MTQCYDRLMAQVLIADLDDALLDDYRRVADNMGHSLEAELREALVRSRPKRRLSRDELVSLSRRLRAMTPPDAREIDSTPIIREARDKGYGFSG